MEHIRYSVAACQTDLANPIERRGMRANTERILSMIDSAVADTPIGRIGCAICYDWLFPEAMRQLAANGAEVLVRVSAYMDPWGATEPMAWWTIVNRCRALENVAYVVAANQGTSLKHYPPYSWPGGSQVVDYDGRLLAEASPGPGERIVVAPIDISALR